MQAENNPPTAGLPEGTRVGPWRLLEERGRGSYGVVYRAERAGQEKQGPVALKLALAPGDARFEREVELLSRLHHEAVPKLKDAGHWSPPGGGLYPYLAMEWVEGTPLYEWADGHIPTSRQVLQWLARLASALEATHQAGGVHRDVKGDNVLVRHEDGRVLLQRMLSVEPQARGSAGELAEALEEAARNAGPEADRPLWVWPVAPRPEPAQAPRAKTTTREPARARRAWLGAAALALGVLLGRGVHWPEPSTMLPPQEARDGGSAGLAEEASAGPGDPLSQSAAEEPVSRRIPPQPFPGQKVPDASGRCRGAEAPINGGCWLPFKTDTRDCERLGYFEHESQCYVPMYPPPRPPVLSNTKDNTQP